MIHTTLLVFAISVYVASVAFLYLKDFLPACNGVQIDVKLEDSMIIFFSSKLTIRQETAADILSAAIQTKVIQYLNIIVMS